MILQNEHTHTHKVNEKIQVAMPTTEAHPFDFEVFQNKKLKDTCAQPRKKGATYRSLRVTLKITADYP